MSRTIAAFSTCRILRKNIFGHVNFYSNSRDSFQLKKITNYEAYTPPITKTSHVLMQPEQFSEKTFNLEDRIPFFNNQSKVRDKQKQFQQHAGVLPTHQLGKWDLVINRFFYSAVVIGVGLAAFEAYNLIFKVNFKERP